VLQDKRDTYYKTKEQSKKQEKKRKEDKYLIPFYQIQLMNSCEGCSGVNQFYV